MAETCPDCGEPMKSESGRVHVAGSRFCVGRRLFDAKSENARLQAIVDRLPKTADGETILPGQRLWYFVRTHPEVLWINVDHWGEDHIGGVVWGESQHEPMDSISTSACYSTRAAAEAAQKDGLDT